MKNSYEIRGSETVVFVQSNKYGMVEVLISTEHLEKVQTHKGTWSVNWNKKTQSLYCRGGVKKSYGKQRSFYLHRYILNCPDDRMVDHKNNNTLDNTIENLRIVNNSENQQNRGKLQRNNTSGVAGVTLHKKTKKWRARIIVNQMSKSLGLYDSFEEAKSAVANGRAMYMPFSKEAANNH